MRIPTMNPILGVGSSENLHYFTYFCRGVSLVFIKFTQSVWEFRCQKCCTSKDTEDVFTWQVYIFDTNLGKPATFTICQIRQIGSSVKLDLYPILYDFLIFLLYDCLSFHLMVNKDPGHERGSHLSIRRSRLEMRCKSMNDEPDNSGRTRP